MNTNTLTINLETQVEQAVRLITKLNGESADVFRQLAISAINFRRHIQSLSVAIGSVFIFAQKSL
jgi:hypothetical protein